jgi:hypothetical protein
VNFRIADTFTDSLARLIGDCGSNAVRLNDFVSVRQRCAAMSETSTR